MFSSFPDRTFVFALIALLMSIAALAYLLFGQAIEITGVGTDGELYVKRVNVFESHGMFGVAFAVIPPIITLGAIMSVPPSGKSETRHKFNLIFGTLLLWTFVGIFFRQLGALYIPAATMLTSVAVLMFIRQHAWGKNPPRPRAKTARKLREKALRRNQRSGNTVGRRPRRRLRRRN